MSANAAFLDGTDGCKCGPACEHPCFLRLGLTTRPCCPGCPPLPDFSNAGTEHEAIELTEGK